MQSINNYIHVPQEEQKSISRIFGVARLQCFKLVETRKTSKSNADSSRAIIGCCVLRRKFHHQYQLVCPCLQQKDINNKVINE